MAYILPKEFPPRFRGSSHTDNDGESLGHGTPFRSRRGSVGEKNVLQFMAAIDMWVPYVSRPPRAPYLVSYVHFQSLLVALSF